MKLEGLLVDLVPYGKQYQELEYGWRNNESSFWGSGGDRRIVTKAQVAAMFRERAEEIDSGQWNTIGFGMQTKQGKPIGMMSVNWILPFSRLAMLGAKIGEAEYWGGGYGTDALLLVIEYCFEWLDMHKVWLSTTDANQRVMRQMDKVGFALEGRSRQESLMDGRWVDGLIYGMLREEWPGREAMIARLGLRARPEA